MKRNFFRVLLSAALMMCCVNVWALYGSRGGTYKGQVEVYYGIYDLYQNYSYTYEGTTQSVSGNCAVLVGFSGNALLKDNAESTVSYGGINYTVVAIGEQVFYYNNYLIEEFTIPNTVRVLEAFALEDNTTKLNKIILEDGDADLFCYRTTGSYGAFSLNRGLKNVYIGRNLQYQEQINNKIDYAPFYKGKFSGLSVEFGPKVTAIPQNCFYSSDFSSIDFSKATSLNSIGHHAFYWNNSCTEIDLRNCSSNLVIGESSFQDCDALQKVTIGGAQQIVDYAFYDCNALIRVDVLGDVSSVRPYAFRCPNLALVYFLSSKSPVFENYCFNSTTPIVYVRDADRLNDFNNHYTFTGGIYAVPESQKVKYTTVSGQLLGGLSCLLDTYEDGVRTMYLDYWLDGIYEYTFNKNNDLQSIIIPPSVKTIGKDAFRDCVNLASVSIPNSVTSIGELAFNCCYNLRTVLISGNPTSIGESAFGWCTALNEIFYLGNKQPTIGNDVFFYETPVTIYVKDTNGFDSSWDGRPVKSWRSGKGDGTKTNPLVIEDYAQLMGFAIEVSQQGSKDLCGILAKDIVGNRNVLKSDGSLNGNLFKEWMPIGSATNVFCGEFNGDGHTISGLYHNQCEKGSCVGLFGRTGEGAYIHDLGVVDSYMYGGNWNAGICGDMAYGLIDKCFNAATVPWGGGIAGSCWVKAQITNCFNVGHIYHDGGGITGYVFGNLDKTYSIENCYTLAGVCEHAINMYVDNCTDKVNNVETLSSDAFASGEVCWKLNGKAMGTQWSQKIGTDNLPKLMGTNVVYHDDVVGYVNVTKCDVAESGLHSFSSRGLEWCDGTKAYYLHCSDCGKYYRNDNLMVAVSEPSTWKYHDAHYVAVVLPTPTETGIKHHWHCQRCNEDFVNEDCTTSFTRVNPIEIPTIKNNEIWYSTTDNNTLSFDGAFNTSSIKANMYRSDYGVSIITFNEEVTAIKDYKCTDYNTLVSIYFPSTVKSIGQQAFYGSGSLVDVQLPSSLESVGKLAFGDCPNIKSLAFGPSLKSIGMGAFQNSPVTFMTFKSLPNIDYNLLNANSHLDLTDSEKPFIGTTSLPKNLHFVGAQYHRSLEQDKWGTIVLPFAPTGGMEGLEFYELKRMTTENGGSLVFAKAETVKAGVPYLFRNTSSTTDFTLTNDGNTTVTVGVSNQTAGDFTLKGSFQQIQLDGTTNRNLYYLKNNEFYHANGKINIAPFRTYIEAEGISGEPAKSFLLLVSNDDDEVTAIPGILGEDGTIDEAEAIYDLGGRRLTAPVKGQVNVVRLVSGKTIKRMF